MFLGCFWGCFRGHFGHFWGCNMYIMTFDHFAHVQWHNTTLHHTCYVTFIAIYDNFITHTKHLTTFRISVSFTRSYSCLRLIVSIFIDTVLRSSFYYSRLSASFITLVSIHFDDTHLIHSILYGSFVPSETLPTSFPLRVSCKNDRVFSVRFLFYIYFLEFKKIQFIIVA